jgi:Putative Flp pilus-assembly TadE/G-like
VSALLTRVRRDSGQAMLFMVFALMGLVGMASLVVDGGSWFRTQRQVQTAADAAALAGAQDLPLDQTAALANANSYAQQNFAGIAAPVVSFPSAAEIDVVAERPVSGIFLPALNATARAHARAQVSAPDMLKNVAPIAVYKDLACIVSDPTCFGQPVTLAFDEDAEFDPTKSKFGLLDLDRDGTIGAGEMKDWLENGYPDALPINTDYPPANGEKNGIKQQLEDAADDERVLLFPVYDSANATTGYHVIGWAAFIIDEVVKWDGHEHELTGHFVTFIASDLAAGNPITDPDLNFGVKVITLTQ